MRNNIILSGVSVLVFAILFSACSEENIKYQRYFSDGLQLYKTHCENCHMKDGSGLVNIIPPLTDTAFLSKNRNKLACYIAYGLSDTITINNVEYSGVMPAEKHLAAIDIAKVLTYITNSFGNEQGIYDVTEVQNNLNKVCK
jgi:mono/diheme cytochrome c family protein